MDAFREWVERRKAWYANYGIASERLRFYELTEAERPHYAKAGMDVEYLFPWGWGELESIAHRGTYDLDAHVRLSGKDLRFFDEASKTHYTPLLIESSAGMDRTVLTFMIDAYERERGIDPDGKETERTVLRFHPRIAPVQVAVFSLARNKPELVERARGDRGGAPAEVSHAIRRGQHRAALPAARRDRNAVLRHRRLRDAGRRQRNAALARLDAAAARRRGIARRASAERARAMTVEAPAKYVYFFDEGEQVRVPSEPVSMKNALGGKGAGLAEMTSAGLPVPSGFTITTRPACAFYDAGGVFPDGLAGSDRRRDARARTTHRQRLRLGREPPARLGAQRRAGLDARNDGHDPQPRASTTTRSTRSRASPRTSASRGTRTGAS